jgi:hypothetical protein
LTLVNMAVEERRRNDREQGEIDEFWCLFDVEWPQNHPRLGEAVQKAECHQVRLAISNPCFELWLILHHEDQRSFLDTSTAESKRRRHDGSKGKQLDPAVYMPDRSVARRRAEDLKQAHRRNGTDFPHDNPSSGMFLLLDSVEPTTGV